MFSSARVAPRTDQCASSARVSSGSTETTTSASMAPAKSAIAHGAHRRAPHIAMSVKKASSFSTTYVSAQPARMGSNSTLPRPSVRTQCARLLAARTAHRAASSAVTSARKIIFMRAGPSVASLTRLAVCKAVLTAQVTSSHVKSVPRNSGMILPKMSALTARVKLPTARTAPSQALPDAMSAPRGSSRKTTPRALSARQMAASSALTPRHAPSVKTAGRWRMASVLDAVLICATAATRSRGPVLSASLDTTWRLMARHARHAQQAAPYAMGQTHAFSATPSSTSGSRPSKANASVIRQKAGILIMTAPMIASAQATGLHPRVTAQAARHLSQVAASVRKSLQMPLIHLPEASRSSTTSTHHR